MERHVEDVRGTAKMAKFLEAASLGGKDTGAVGGDLPERHRAGPDLPGKTSTGKLHPVE
jgi:hypothetical protein